MAIYTEETADYIWRNGNMIPWAEATIHVNAVGHASVAAIFEGIKAYWNEEQGELYVFRLAEHLERFLNSIRMVRYGCEYDAEQLHQAVPGKATELIIDSWPFASYREMNQALNVCVSSWTRISDNVMPPRLKCFSNYHNGRLAAMDAVVAGYDWPIMPVASVDRLPVGSGQTGPITLRIAQAYRRLVTGRDDRHPEWRTPVWRQGR